MASYFVSLGHLILSLFLCLKLGKLAAFLSPKHANFMKKREDVLVPVLEIGGRGVSNGWALEDLMAEFRSLDGRGDINK